jgi:hypothetical protein
MIRQVVRKVYITKRKKRLDENRLGIEGDKALK